MSRRVGQPEQTPEPIVRFRAVTKRFGPQTVLDGLDLDVARGRTTVILGPSGSGKSVLLKHIVGLLRPDAGEIYFEDVRVDRLPERRMAPIRRRIGYLFQLSALFDSMTVRENLEFPLIEHTAAKPAERRRRVAEALATVDLAGVEDKRPSELSGGQQKRAALARAIILMPELILYDEPTTGLDPIRADGINNLILKLQRDLGVTGIVVTHDLTSAEKVGDRVVILLDGRVRADGSLAQLRSSTDRRVRSFLAGRDEGDALGDTGKGSAA